MKTIGMALAIILTTGSALACEIEDWRWYESIPGMIMIEGSATCAEGLVTIRAYEGKGEGERFLGTATGFLTGYAFQAILEQVSKPSSLTIRYSIDRL